MSVVGFDFGSHKCVVAVARRRGIDVLQNEVGSRSTPSCVAFAGKTRLMGTEALAQQMSNPKNTVNTLKRLLGRPIDDPTLSKEHFNFTTLSAPFAPAMLAVEVAYDDKREIFAPEQLTGALFQKLKATAEGGLEGASVTDCVISCPPWWNDVQRRALLDAANVAGLNVLRLMNETSAIGLNYGILNSRLPKDKESRVLFIDMGHASTNCAVLSFTENKLTVLGTASDPDLGGRGFDDVLVTHFAARFKEKYKMDVTGDVKAMLKLRKECERVKLHLSANVKVQFNVEYIMNDRDVSGEIDRPAFEGLAAQSLLPRLTSLASSLLTRLNIKPADLYSIEVVGGAVRIPAVQKSLSDFFARDLSKTCDGDESVARGCALMCAMISPSFKVKEFEVHDASPYPIALECSPLSAPEKPDNVTQLFSVNNPIPSVKLISFDRSESFQLVARYSDQASLPAGTFPTLGRFVISGLPKKPSNKVKVRVKLNLHGILSVTGAQLIEEVEEEAGKSDVPMADATSPPSVSPPPASSSPSSSNGSEEKMDTSEAGTEPSKEAKEAAATVTKKKVHKTDLVLEAHYTGGLKEATMKAFFEREAAMCNQDRVIAETLQSKNDLETYVLEMRNKLSDELSQYASDSDKERIGALLTENEDWLYGDGYDAQKSEYKKRLNELKQLGDPIVARRFEADHRNEYAGELKSTIGHYQRFVASTEEKYAHITAEERQKVAVECQNVDEWLSTSLTKADHANKTENPPLTVAQLRAKKEQLDKFALPIVNKVKKAVVEEKKEEPKPSSEAATSKSSSPPPAAEQQTPNMDTSAP